MRRLSFVLLTSAAPVAAEVPILGLPVACTIGQTCHIEDYVDRDPAPGVQQDFACGMNTRDGHKGTDIALTDWDAMARGVNVLAAAAGTVAVTRDGMADDRTMQGVTSQNACGNAVVLDHGDGWTTWYCHMKQGSVAVQKGQVVPAGTVLGQVGLSGMTSHPHLHIGLRKDNAPVDPFGPGPVTCDQPQDTLWADPPAYIRTAMIATGFADHVPDMDAVRDGTARLETTAADKPLVVYSRFGHAQQGDVIEISATGPQGDIFREKFPLDDVQLNMMRAFGRKAPANGWPKGEYRGQVTLTRDRRVIANRYTFVTVD